MLLIIILILFLAFSAIAELYIYRKNIKTPPRRRWKKAYVWLFIGLWSLTLILRIVAEVMPAPPEWYIKFNEVLLLFFIFNGISKIIFAALTWLGRKVGLLSQSYALATTIILLINCVMTYGATSGRLVLRTERVDIVSQDIPEAFDSLRIALFSDVHAGSLLDKHDILTKMVQQINALDADIVINCGDLINSSYKEIGDKTTKILSGIHSRYGVYSVLGNHDLGIYIHNKKRITPEEHVRRLVEKQRSMGWVVLRDSTVNIVIGQDTLYITGLEYPDELTKRSHSKIREPYDYDALLADVPDGASSIVISHAPQVWDWVRQTGKSNLMVSGHVHAMQMRMKIGKGRYISPAGLFYDRWSGYYGEDNGHLYINDGIGYGLIPMRIGTKPEITLIELRNNVGNSFCSGIE